MTYNELQAIMDENHICPFEYSINGRQKILAESAITLTCDGHKYFCDIISREKVIEHYVFESETEACQCFLKTAVFDWPILKKYL